MNKLQLRRYAKLIAKAGVNVKKGQWVIIEAGLDQPEFVEMLVEELYRAGAGKVSVEWSYLPLASLHYKYQETERLSSIPKWEIEKWELKAKELPAIIMLDSDDPNGLKGIDQDKLSKVIAARTGVIKTYRDRMDNRYQWCVVAVPGKAWAKTVFPHLNANQAVEKLWDAILKGSRADGPDPLRAWAEHNDNLARRCDYLNRLGLVSLEYKSQNGTNFKVGLIENCIFMGGGEENMLGHYYNPNIPTEEIFTTPMAGDAEGIVYSTKPLTYQGELIEDFSVRFEKGRAVEVKAKKNEALLKKLISMDNGASMLGEVALIPYNSPINNLGILFYNTLYDENASCHLAFGRGFTNNYKGYENLTREELTERGLNDSVIHVDFMIGTRDMEITGITKKGERIPIFTYGNWAF